MSTPPSGDKPAASTATIPPPSPEGMAVAQKLAVLLGETEEKPIMQLARAVDVLTAEKAETYANEALEVAAGDGILTRDGSRKRTPGGTFFALVRQREAKDHKVWRKIKPVMKPKSEQPVTLADQMPDLIEMTGRLKAGPVTGVKAILTGRPVTIQKQAQFVAFTLKAAQPPALPKGLPTFKGETKYLILAAIKQWEKVEKKITEDKADQLYIEGYSTIQADFKTGIVVLAINLNTIGLMRTRKK